MKQTTIQEHMRRPTLAERGPRTKLYVIPASVRLMTWSPIARQLHWGITFTSDKEAADEIRQYFHLPLSLCKKLMVRQWYGYCGLPRTGTWRNHPAGFDGDDCYDIEVLKGLISMMRKK